MEVAAFEGIQAFERDIHIYILVSCCYQEASSYSDSLAGSVIIGPIL